MSKKKGGFIELLYKSIMPKVYGIGASIVIIGAMFKILHLPGAGEMLAIGLTVEAIIFFLSAFEPAHKETDWSKVYPELSDDYSGSPKKVNVPIAKGAAVQMDQLLAEAKVGPELIKSLGSGMKNLSDTTRKLSSLGEAAIVTNQYTTNVKLASKTISEMNKSYESSISAVNSMSEASKSAKEYHGQVQNVTKSLGALNVLYEMELKDAQSHTKALNKFYTNMTSALEGMSNAGKETTQFQKELSMLTSNVANLNKVYGSMLTAMKGN